MLGGMVALAFSIRFAYPFQAVYGSGVVQFQDADAWHHRRLIEFQVRHFPSRLVHDPYGAFPDGPPVAVGPAFDFGAATILWLTGAVQPRPWMDAALALYPALLGALIVVPVFWFHRWRGDPTAAWLSAVVVATLPGHFLKVTALGFTDHHVQESLLTAAILAALARHRQLLERGHAGWRWPLISGVLLGAYLLTWVGGAFLVAILVAWSAVQLMRDAVNGHQAIVAARGMAAMFAVAFAIAWPFQSLLWMPYALAATAVGLGVNLTGLLPRHGRVSFDPRWSLPLGAGLGTLIVWAIQPELLATIVTLARERLVPSGTAGTVLELRPLWLSSAEFTLVPAFQQYGLSIFAAAAAIPWLTLRALRSGRGAELLLAVYGASTLAAALFQVRMGTYFAPAAALLSGWLVAECSARWRWRKVALGVAALLLVVPSQPFYVQLLGRDAGPSADWREALVFLRDQTPEPYGQDGQFWRATAPPQRPAYGVLAWWDFGYWITGLAHRVPFANPTQLHATDAARILLTASEDAAVSELKRLGLRYVVLDPSLPWLPVGDGRMTSSLPQVATWAGIGMERYVATLYRLMPNGLAHAQVFLKPAYFETLLYRLYFAGLGTPGAVGSPDKPIPLVYWESRESDIGQSYRAVVAEQTAPTMAEARRKIDASGGVAEVLTENPLAPPVPLAPWPRFQPVFRSSGPSPVVVFELR